MPGRLEFAIEVRQAILRDRPQVVALELPATLQPAWMRAVARLPEMSLIFYPDETGGDDQAVYVPVEPADPFTEAIRTGLEIGAEIVFADPDAGTRPHLQDAYPDSYAIRHIGLERYVEAYRVYPQARSDEIAQHAAGIAWKLQGADPSERAGGGLAEPARSGAGCHGGAASAAHGRASGGTAWSCSIRIPTRWGKSRSSIRPCMAIRELPPSLTDTNLIDRRHAQLAVFREAEKEYEANTGERSRTGSGGCWRGIRATWRWRRMTWSAGIFDLTVAARGVADDNFAWEVWEAAGRYPPQKTDSDLVTVKISGDEVWMDTRRIRLRRRLPSTKRRLRPVA